MKINCFALNSNLTYNSNQTKIIEFLGQKLYEIGESFSLISYFSNNYEKLKNNLLEDSDVCFVIGTKDSIYNFNIKENISRIIGDRLDNNPTINLNFQKYCTENNIPFSIEEENETKIPSSSIPLICNNYNMFGFISKFSDKYIVFLPDNLQFIEDNFTFLNQILSTFKGSDKLQQIIKCFGILEKDIKGLLSEEYSIDDIEINVIGNDLDNTIFINYPKDMPTNKIQNVVSNIVYKLNKFIYSLENVSIYQMAVELLRLQHKSVCVAETNTCGNIAKELISRDEKVVASNYYFGKTKNIFDTIAIDKSIVEKHGVLSVNTVYELANSILENHSCDIVIFVLGDNSSDMCYMAIGDIDGIHVYKNKINDKSSRLIENMSKIAMFYLIKKLKQNDLQFIKNSV